jgi:flagellar assembly factor FliW
MRVTVNRFGDIEVMDVPENQLFEFQPGLGSFEQYHHYALIVDAESPVEWLQSVDEPSVGFPLIEPFLFYPDYAFELRDADAEALGLENPEQAIVRCVLTVREAAEEITANLLAPVLLNQRTGRGRQVVLQEGDMPLRYPVFEALRLPASA